MLSNKEVDDSIKLYNSGLTLKQISEKLNCSYEKVRSSLKGKLKWKRSYITDLAPEEVTEIVNMFDEQISIKEIALKYKISEPTVSRLLKSFNREAIPISRKYDILRATPINSIQKEFLVGNLLGDGCLYKDNKKSNFKLSFSHQEKHAEYFHWKISMMDPFINNWYKSNNPKKNSVMLHTATICHPDFNKFGEMFYTKDRIKIIPDNLNTYLTPLALAVWIMDDGNLNNVNMRIESSSFTKEENEKLVDYIKDCFNLDSKVMGFKYKNKQYWQMTLDKKNTQILSEIIRPHVVECMKYKLL